MSAVLKKNINDPDPGIAWINRRRAEGLSERQIAAELGVSQGTLWRCTLDGRANYGILGRIYELEARQAPKPTKSKVRRLRLDGKVVKNALGYAALVLSFLLKVAKHFWDERLGK